MSSWIMGAVAVLFWAAAIYFTARDFNRNSRGSLRQKTDQAINEMWGAPEEIAARAVAEPNNAAVAIRHAANAHGDWPELARRGEDVAKRFPKLPHGMLMQVQAHHELGDIEKATRLLGRTRRRFPEDGRAMELSIDQALARNDWPSVIGYAYKLRRRHGTHQWAFIREIEARIQLGQDKRALEVLKLARHEFELQPKTYDEICEHYDAAFASKYGTTPLGENTEPVQ